MYTEVLDTYSWRKTTLPCPFINDVVRLRCPHLDRSMTARLVELLHLRNNLFQSRQPCIEFLLDLSLRLSQFRVEDGSVGTCVHRQLISRDSGVSALSLLPQHGIDSPRTTVGQACHGKASSFPRTPFGTRQRAPLMGSVAIVVVR